MTDEGERGGVGVDAVVGRGAFAAGGVAGRGVSVGRGVAVAVAPQAVASSPATSTMGSIPRYMVGLLVVIVLNNLRQQATDGEPVEHDIRSSQDHQAYAYRWYVGKGFTQRAYHSALGQRLGQVYLDGLVPYEEYRRQKRSLEEKLGSRVVPGVDAAQEAGKLLECLPRLWEAADLGERRRLLLAIVAIRPKPAFRALFEIATTREGSGVVLINEPPPARQGLEAATPCFWWRRGRVELPVQKPP